MLSLPKENGNLYVDQQFQPVWSEDGIRSHHLKDIWKREYLIWEKSHRNNSFIIKISNKIAGPLYDEVPGSEDVCNLRWNPAKIFFGTYILED